jgi:hypothetical protein
MAPAARLGRKLEDKFEACADDGHRTGRGVTPGMKNSLHIRLYREPRRHLDPP